MPKFMSPLIAHIIAHGIITAPEPNIGRASTKPINNAISNGYLTLNPINSSIYSPIKETINDTSINVASAFKYPPNVFIKSLRCIVIFLTHILGK